MSTVSDIITYIGVPLAVLGVAPLLWNMTQAFRLWHKLEESIPKNARHFFSIFMDPASGTVAVTVYHLYLNTSDLLRYKRQEATASRRLPRGVLPSLSFSPGRPDIEERKAASIDLLKRKYFEVTESYLLRATWMGLLDTQTSVQYSPVMARRFTLDSTMSIEPPFLDVKWPDFVYLALGLGVDAYDWDLHELIRALLSQSPTRALRLQDHNGCTKIKVPSTNGRVFASLALGRHSLSWRRALAWELIMLLEDDTSIKCVSLMTSDEFYPSDISSFTPFGLSIATSRSGDGRILATYRQREFSQASDQLQCAIPWVFYIEQVYKETNEILPTCQAMLNLRLKVLDELERYLVGDATEALLTSVLRPDSESNEILRALQSCWADDEYRAFKKRQVARYRLYFNASAPDHLPERTRRKDLVPGKKPDSFIDAATLLEHNSNYRDLTTAYNPVPRLRTEAKPAINDIKSPAGLLARILLATSILQFWPCIHVQDNECLDEADPSNPLSKIFQEEDRRSDNIGVAIYFQ